MKGAPTMHVACPHCGASYELPADLGGLPIPCRKCDQRFTPPVSPEVAAADDRWRRRRTSAGPAAALGKLRKIVLRHWRSLAIGGAVVATALAIVTAVLAGSGGRPSRRVTNGSEPDEVRAWRNGSNIEHDVLFEGRIFTESFLDGYTRSVMKRFWGRKLSPRRRTSGSWAGAS